jgi:hypothetical protein
MYGFQDEYYSKEIILLFNSTTIVFYLLSEHTKLHALVLIIVFYVKALLP